MTQKGRRSERCRCQTSALAFSALRAPNGELFRAPRSKAPEATETTMTANSANSNATDPTPGAGSMASDLGRPEASR